MPDERDARRQIYAHFPKWCVVRHSTRPGNLTNTGEDHWFEVTLPAGTTVGGEDLGGWVFSPRYIAERSLPPRWYHGSERDWDSEHVAVPRRAFMSVRLFRWRTDERSFRQVKEWYGGEAHGVPWPDLADAIERWNREQYAAKTLGKCPVCGRAVVARTGKGGKRYMRCADDGCGFRASTRLYGRELSDAELSAVLAGEQPVVEGVRFGERTESVPVRLSDGPAGGGWYSMEPVRGGGGKPAVPAGRPAVEAAARDLGVSTAAMASIAAAALGGTDAGERAAAAAAPTRDTAREAARAERVARAVSRRDADGDPVEPAAERKAGSRRSAPRSAEISFDGEDFAKRAGIWRDADGERCEPSECELLDSLAARRAEIAASSPAAGEGLEFLGCQWRMNGDGRWERLGGMSPEASVLLKAIGAAGASKVAQAAWEMSRDERLADFDAACARGESPVGERSGDVPAAEPAPSPRRFRPEDGAVVSFEDDGGNRRNCVWSAPNAYHSEGFWTERGMVLGMAAQAAAMAAWRAAAAAPPAKAPAPQRGVSRGR